jgi:hypothetical protein
LFRFYTETASFGVSIEPKQTEDQPKQTETNRNESNMKNIYTLKKEGRSLAQRVQLSSEGYSVAQIGCNVAQKGTA